MSGKLFTHKYVDAIKYLPIDWQDGRLKACLSIISGDNPYFSPCNILNGEMWNAKKKGKERKVKQW